MSPRLTLALQEGGFALPESGTVLVLHPRADMDLSDLPRDRVRVEHPFRPDHDRFATLGYQSAAQQEGHHSAALVCLPRAKALARALIARAADTTEGPIIVDGQKTDGIDSVLRDIRKRVDVSGPISKAHGKIFWFTAAPDLFEDWRAPETQSADGFVTAPGVFSADAIDPASAFLTSHLPEHVGRYVVDLGAGWGYLSRQLLGSDKLRTLDLVEADHSALTCARANISDDRARFHWADATTWAAERPMDAVVMNPPFHPSRAADPALGQAFITSAARMLAPNGVLWLVANRHLPYETTLNTAFAQVEQVADNGRFKVLRATRPQRSKR